MDARNLTPKEMARMIADFANCHDKTDLKEVAEELCNEHRTLQQLSMGMFLEFIKKTKEYGDQGFYDLRNEDSYRFSKLVCEAVDKNEFYGFRYI